jgi:hypothetical protein
MLIVDRVAANAADSTAKFLPVHGVGDGGRRG